MKLRQSGMVLFFTLMLLSILSVLLLAQLSILLAHQKSMNQIRQRYETQHALETFAQGLLSEASLSWKTSCMVSGDRLPNSIPEKLAKHGGCVAHQGRYAVYFLMESLGDFPCVQVIDKGLPYSTRHWRLTVLTDNAEALQIRLVTPITYLACPSADVSLVREGIISWRQWQVSPI